MGVPGCCQGEDSLGCWSEERMLCGMSHPRQTLCIPVEPWFPLSEQELSLAPSCSSEPTVGLGSHLGPRSPPLLLSLSLHRMGWLYPELGAQRGGRSLLLPPGITFPSLVFYLRVEDHLPFIFPCIFLVGNELHRTAGGWPRAHGQLSWPRSANSLM